MLRRTFCQSAAAAAALAAFRTTLSFAKGNPVTDDPLLAPWTGPYGGFPRFDKVKVADVKPALMKAMDLNRAEIAAIASSKAAPTFENTIAALEVAGRPLNRVSAIFNVYTATMADPPVRQLEQEMAPVLAAFFDEFIQNEALFARIKAVYDARATAKLTPEQVRLVEVVYRGFARQGAALSAADKARLREINGKLASLYTKFGQNELADEEHDALELTSEAELAGLPDLMRTSAKEAAEAKGRHGKWLITNTRSSVEPFLVYSTRRDLREKAWRMWVSRGEHAG